MKLRAHTAPWAAGATIALLAVDAARQVALGVADAGLWFFAAATCVGVAAALAISRWPERRRMAVLVLAWLFLGVATDLAVDWPASRLVVTLWTLATALLPATYALMVLAYPAGRLPGRMERPFVAVAYVVGLAWMSVPLLFADPRGCAGCSPRATSLLFVGDTFDIAPFGKAFAAIFVVLGAAFIALVVRRMRAAPPGARITLLPFGLAAVAGAADFVALRVVVLAGWEGATPTIDWIDRVTTFALPAAILAGILAIRRRRGPVGDLVVELGCARPNQIGAALRRALGDPTLELALWLPDRRAYVDYRGRRVEPTTAPGRAVTLIGPRDEPVAALVHDERLVGQRPLMEAAGSAARLALANARLQAELRAQLVELRASRRRLVAAADAERRRLERDLHDGAQQRLLALGLNLQLLRDRQADPQLLAQAERELHTALRELRDLARGIHPAILSERGLAGAVRSLADRAPVPISLQVGEDRYPHPVEAAAYFVISEALANVAKHARAASASVAVARVNGHLVVEVTDDGRGGATAGAGGGLQGLADRVGALDGALIVDSRVAAGTTIRAEIPCASS